MVATVIFYMSIKRVTMRNSLSVVLMILCVHNPAWAADDPPQRDEMIVETSRAGLTVLEMPVNTSILDQADIRESAAQTVDVILRQVPGFSLLRAADSIAASPTTSTASLRGLGGSAASRTLILLDGVPIHSPYSSEVYWARIPRHQIERVEVVRGAGANSWGNLSLGGVINILTEKPREDGVDFSAAVGYPETIDLNVAGSQVVNKWTISGNATYFDTVGYEIIPEHQQGPIDENARKDFAIVSGKVAYDFNDQISAYMNGSWFKEERNAGTPMDMNTSEIGSFGAGLDLATADGSQWAFKLFYDDNDLHDVSVRINDARDAEQIRTIRDQPTSALGTSVVWEHQIGAHHTLSAGADYRWTEMSVNELGRFLNDMPREYKVTTGDQDMGGVFAQDIWKINDRWQLNGSVRFDYVTNNGMLEITDLTSGMVDFSETYEANTETTVNPSFGVRFQATEWVSLRGAAYKGFRAPTMRELYRSAVTRGGVVLVNNPDLEPERLVGIEGGADFILENNVTVRVTIFQNIVEDLIQNITRGVAGNMPEVIPPCGLIDAGDTCRELANVGEMEATGVELETEYRPSEKWSFFLSYLYNDTEVTEAPDNPQIVGKQIRQAPKNSFTARIRNGSRWFDTTLQGRYVGDRYEDDLNSLAVDEFFVLDATFSRDIGASGQVFLSIENLLDEEYEIRVDNNGFTEIGRPRFVNLGFRYRH